MDEPLLAVAEVLVATIEAAWMAAKKSTETVASVCGRVLPEISARTPGACFRGGRGRDRGRVRVGRGRGQRRVHSGYGRGKVRVRGGRGHDQGRVNGGGAAVGGWVVVADTAPAAVKFFAAAVQVALRR